MCSFFQKKLILWDVDFTLINWSSPAVLWRFRRDWNSKSQLTQVVGAYRGTRKLAAHKTVAEHQIAFQPNSWEHRAIQYLQQNGHFVAIYSDFPQPSLSAWFETLGVHFISIGSETGTFKPLPDGCIHLMTQLGVVGSATFLIGDGRRTDARAISQVGGHFIPIEEVRDQSVQVFDEWIS